MKLANLKSLCTLLLCFCVTAVWGQRTVTGTVTDESGFEVPGVAIAIKGTTSGTVSDVDGTYSITVPDGDAILVFSFLGYSTQEIPVNGRSTIDVSIESEAEVLQDVVVIGYGKQRKEAVTGAVSSVSGETLEEVVTPNLGTALQGRLAGVQVVSGGPPGQTPEIQIRGIGSVSFGSGPLYVVDGVPTGGLNTFDARDIASVNVLKDASSTAIYGSRASNGVVLITTKTGRAQEGLKINLHSTVGQSFANDRLDLLNTEQYLQFADQLGAIIARDLDQPINSTTSQTYRQTNTDWQEELFEPGLLTQNNLSISGGNETSRFYTSFGYVRDEGVMQGPDYERYNIRLNSDHTLAKGLTFGQTLLTAYDDRNIDPRLGGRTQILQAIQSVPYIPVFNPDNIGGFAGTVQAEDSSDPGNPILAANLLRNNDKVLRVFGTLFLDYELFDGLNLRATYGADYSTFRNSSRNPIYEATVNSDFNSISETRNINYSPLYSGQISYRKLIGDHNIDVIAVGELQENYSNFSSSSVDQTTNSINSLSGGINQNVSGGNSTTILQSLVGRLNYGYKGKYLFTFSFRRDGSSIFAPGNQYENFPAGAVAWRISEEPFMQNTGISELKVRASYGRTGSIGLGPYSFQAPINNSFGPVFGEGVQPVGAFINSIANDQLRWELTDMLNIGVDLGFLNNRLQVSAEYYDRQVDNLILDVQLPNSVGVGSTRQNIGALSNTGFEVQTTFYSSRTSKFTWDVSANISANTNEVISLDSENADLFGGSDTEYSAGFPISIIRAGEPINSFFGFQVDRLYQSMDEIRRDYPDQTDEQLMNSGLIPGATRFVDLNGDGVITDEDRTVIGNYLPDFIYGVNFNGKVSGLDFNVFLQGSQGNDVYNGTRVLTSKFNRLFNGGVELLDAWTPQNTDTDQPVLQLNDPNQERRTSDRYVEDASYLRLKNVTVGYTLPLASQTLDKVRIYVSGQNLVTLTDYTGLDPEVGINRGGLRERGIDYGQYPVSKSILFGVQLGF